MSLVQKSDILKTVNGWGLCPVCARKVMRVRDDTFARNLVLYCKGCKTHSLVNIGQCQCQSASAD